MFAQQKKDSVLKIYTLNPETGFWTQYRNACRLTMIFAVAFIQGRLMYQLLLRNSFSKVLVTGRMFQVVCFLLLRCMLSLKIEPACMGKSMV